MSRAKKAIAAGIGAAGTGMLSVAATLAVADATLDAKTAVIGVLTIFGGAFATGGATYSVTNDVG